MPPLESSAPDTQRLVLWDVDGTLVRVGPIGGGVFATAVERALGRHPGDHGVPMGGKTDPQIAREILATMELVDEAAEEHLPVVLDHLERALAEAVDRIREEGRVMPGVPELLQALDGRAAQTLLTGNTAANAALKVGALGLDTWLDLEAGAYGSDHHDRRELVPVALERQRTLRGRNFDAAQAWVVGDTAHDLACARAAGVRCLLVATGREDVEELEALGPDAVLADLSRTDDVVDLLLS